MRGSEANRRRARLRSSLLLGCWLAASALLGWRAVEVQLVDGARWKALAEGQHRMSSEVPAARGSILDRRGTALAVSHETFQVALAPGEIRDPEGVRDRLVEVLGISAQRAGALTGSEQRWVVVPGRYSARVRESLGGTQGVYVERELRRFYPREELVRGVLGSVIDGMGAGGIERAHDELLRGESGTQVVARDSGGRPIPGESWVVRPPRPGGEVVLTLDADLQEIAYEALVDALERSRARGGDLVVTDPRSGEILAMVSMRDGQVGHLSSINTPYEPGSTLKPFTVAGLLNYGLARMSDSVDVLGGQWTVNGRTITDVARYDVLSLEDALRVSSNVGIARLATRLSADQQYETLRDFGFGTPTGVSLPGEVAGTLRRPDRWSRQSPASLAIGYEIGVTPLQMVMAYGALANGGLLMEPRIVRELRGPDGRTLLREEPREVRRVLPREVAEEVNAALVGAVEDGTGTRARLASFQVAGKSGTSRAHGPGGYRTGDYFASFIGFFPAESPQLLVFVKLEGPRGEYYGGAAAAPVTRATMEAVLAARHPPLDRRALASLGRTASGSATRAVPPVGFVSTGGGPAELFRSSSEPGDVVTVSAEGGSGTTPGPAASEGTATVPDVAGLPARAAVRRLHAHGFRVEWDGAATVHGTIPAGGEALSPGETVRLVGESESRPAGAASPPGRGG